MFAIFCKIFEARIRAFHLPVETSLHIMYNTSKAQMCAQILVCKKELYFGT